MSLSVSQTPRRASARVALRQAAGADQIVGWVEPKANPSLMAGLEDGFSLAACRPTGCLLLYSANQKLPIVFGRAFSSQVTFAVPTAEMRHTERLQKESLIVRFYAEALVVSAILQ